MKQTRLPPVRTATWRNVWLGLGLCVCLGAANAATIDALVTTDGGQPLGDAVVVAAPHAVSLEAVTADATLDQIDKQFMPGLLVVQVGTRVHFPNHDHVADRGAGVAEGLLAISPNHPHVRSRQNNPRHLAGIHVRRYGPLHAAQVGVA